MSSRLACVSDDSDSEDDYANESTRAPEGNPVWEAEDKKWKNYAVGKFVYFRWSTAHNSKNKFRGVVLEHRSRVPRPGYTVTSVLSDNSRRVEYLDIKTYGISEDTYVMGKDIREMYVLPSKSVLMNAETEDDIRRLAVRKWTSKNGWESRSETSSNTSTAASTPKISASIPIEQSTAASSVGQVKKPRHYGKKQRRNSYEPIPPPPSAISFTDLFIPETDGDGIFGMARHTKRAFAHRIKFAFSVGIY